MAFIKYINRLKRLDSLIRRKATGTPDELAIKMNLSRAALMRYLSEMRELGAPIKYDRDRMTYHYTKENRFQTGFEILTENEKENIKGGWSMEGKLRVPLYEMPKLDIHMIF